MKSTRGAGVLSVLALVTPMIALAQPGLAPGVNPEGRGYFLVGGGAPDIDALNTSLGAADHPQFRDGVFTLGGGGHALLGRLLLGAEGHGVLGSTRSLAGADFDSRLAGGYGLVNVGYAVLRGGDFTAYPILGFGAGAVNVRLSERGTPSFDDVMVDPRRSSDLVRVSALAQVGVGADRLFIIGSEGEGEGGLVLGLRMGYLFAPFSSQWMMEGGRTPGGPDTTLQGPYIRLMLGGGGRPLGDAAADGT